MAHRLHHLFLLLLLPSPALARSNYERSACSFEPGPPDPAHRRGLPIAVEGKQGLLGSNPSRRVGPYLPGAIFRFPIEQVAPQGGALPFGNPAKDSRIRAIPSRNLRGVCGEFERQCNCCRRHQCGRRNRRIRRGFEQNPWLPAESAPASVVSRRVS